MSAYFTKKIEFYWCKLQKTKNCKNSNKYLRNTCSTENCVASSVNWARDVKYELFHVDLGEFWIGEQSLNTGHF